MIPKKKEPQRIGGFTTPAAFLDFCCLVGDSIVHGDGRMAQKLV